MSSLPYTDNRNAQRHVGVPFDIYVVILGHLDYMQLLDNVTSLQDDTNALDSDAQCDKTTRKILGEAQKAQERSNAATNPSSTMATTAAWDAFAARVSESVRMKAAEKKALRDVFGDALVTALADHLASRRQMCCLGLAELERLSRCPHALAHLRVIPLEMHDEHIPWFEKTRKQYPHITWEIGNIATNYLKRISESDAIHGLQGHLDVRLQTPEDLPFLETICENSQAGRLTLEIEMPGWCDIGTRHLVEYPKILERVVNLFLQIDLETKPGYWNRGSGSDSDSDSDSDHGEDSMESDGEFYALELQALDTMCEKFNFELDLYLASHARPPLRPCTHILRRLMYFEIDLPAKDDMALLNETGQFESHLHEYFVSGQRKGCVLYRSIRFFKGTGSQLRQFHPSSTKTTV